MTRCAWGCRLDLPSEAVEEHELREHWDRDQLVQAATDYGLLRETIGEALNPRDDDVAEVAILLDAVKTAAAALEALPCTCTPEKIEDHDPCARCAALGRLGDKRVER